MHLWYWRLTLSCSDGRCGRGSSHHSTWSVQYMVCLPTGTSRLSWRWCRCSRRSMPARLGPQRHIPMTCDVLNLVIIWAILSIKGFDEQITQRRPMQDGIFPIEWDHFNTLNGTLLAIHVVVCQSSWYYSCKISRFSVHILQFANFWHASIHTETTSQI